MPSKYDFIVGAELEMDVDLRGLKQFDPTGIFKFIYDDDGGDSYRYGEEVEVSLVTALLKKAGIKVDDGGNNEEYTHWVIDFDGSIDTRSGSEGIEIVSPALPYPKFKKEIKAVWKALNGVAKTNYSTGYHHGVSFKQPALNKQFIKRLPYFMWLWVKDKEAEQCRAWGRSNNDYCERYRDLCEPFWSEAELFVEHCLGYADGTDYVGKLRTHRSGRRYPRGGVSVFQADKMQSINITKLFDADKPYIELRFPGGANYHKKVPKALKSVEVVMKLMEETIEGKSKNKLFKFLKNGGTSERDINKVATALGFTS